MRYKFPIITDLSQVEAAIKGREEFIVAEREFGYVVNYLVNFETTFPQINTKDPELNKLYAILRECRGIKFGLDRLLIARTLHKFFNLGERPETFEANVDFEVPYALFDKLDGSMIHPIVMDNQVVCCTKMGITDIALDAQKFVDAKGHKAIFYNDFCWDLMKSKMTPTFEWCSRSNRIVVDYPDDQMILTAIRRMESGEYLAMSSMEALANPYRIPIVQQWQGSFDGIADFVEKAQALEGEEGYVIRFSDGHMLKVKNLWYMQLHKVKALLEFEKDVWLLILDEKQDDLKSVMEDEDKEKIDAFSRDFFAAINEAADRLYWVVVAAKDNLNESKKRFALEVVPQHNDLEKGLLFSIWDGADSVETVKDFVRKHTGTQTKVDHVRPLLGGIKWERYK